MQAETSSIVIFSTIIHFIYQLVNEGNANIAATPIATPCFEEDIDSSPIDDGKYDKAVLPAINIDQCSKMCGTTVGCYYWRLTRQSVDKGVGGISY